jgi:hypothetical protein
MYKKRGQSPFCSHFFGISNRVWDKPAIIGQMDQYSPDILMQQRVDLVSILGHEGNARD